MSEVMCIFVKFWHFFKMPAHQIWSCHVTQEANFENFLFLLILHLILGKVIKFSVEKLSTSEVISQKPHGEGGWKTPPVLLGLNRISWRRSVLGLCQLMCQATAVAQFHVHIFCNCLRLISSLATAHSSCA